MKRNNKTTANKGDRKEPLIHQNNDTGVAYLLMNSDECPGSGEHSGMWNPDLHELLCLRINTQVKVGILPSSELHWNKQTNPKALVIF